MKKKEGPFDGTTLEVCIAATEVLKKIEKKKFTHKGAAVMIAYGYGYPINKSSLQSAPLSEGLIIYDGNHNATVENIFINSSCVENHLPAFDYHLQLHKLH